MEQLIPTDSNPIRCYETLSIDDLSPEMQRALSIFDLEKLSLVQKDYIYSTEINQTLDKSGWMVDLEAFSHVPDQYVQIEHQGVASGEWGQGILAFLNNLHRVGKDDIKNNIKKSGLFFINKCSGNGSTLLNKVIV